jgi:hypothetical protein
MRRRRWPSAVHPASVAQVPAVPGAADREGCFTCSSQTSCAHGEAGWCHPPHSRARLPSVDWTVRQSSSWRGRVHVHHEELSLLDTRHQPSRREGFSVEDERRFRRAPPEGPSGSPRPGESSEKKDPFHTPQRDRTLGGRHLGGYRLLVAPPPSGHPTYTATLKVPSGSRPVGGRTRLSGARLPVRTSADLETPSASQTHTVG